MAPQMADRAAGPGGGLAEGERAGMHSEAEDAAGKTSSVRCLDSGHSQQGLPGVCCVLPNHDLPQSSRSTGV